VTTSSPEFLAAVTFLGVALFVLVPYYLVVVRPERAARAALRRRVRTGGSLTAQPSTTAGILKEVERLSAIGPLNEILTGRSVIATGLRDMIQFSGVRTTPGQIVLGSACLALLTHIVLVAQFGRFWLGGLAGLLVGAMPFVTLRWLRARRLNAFEEHFPEAVDLIARALRAGHAFTTGLRMAADELPEPVAGEFRLLHDQQNYGLPRPDGLKAFARRVPIIDARFFVTAVLTQREAGGNLAEVLDNLSAVIRERFRIKRQLRVITAHGRLTGLVLAALPPALAVFLMIRIPDHFGVLLEDPLGVRMIVVALGLQLLGGFLIHKITNVEY
jgi:tight adherence protein B